MQFEAKAFGSLFAIPQKNGLTRPKKVRGSGLPMVNMGELFAFDRIKDIKMDLVPVSESEQTFFLEYGDLLFARQSLVREGAGKCSIFLGVPRNTVFESHIIRCRLDRAISNPFYYYYFFRSPIGRLAMDTIIEQGAGASGIRGSDLLKLSVPNPPLAVQNQIVDLLASIDEIISLNDESNETLESIAQALFKSWFIDFDPVKAKMADLQPEAMDEATAALFPAEFEESEIGLIPKGWQVKLVGEIFDLNPSYRLTKGSQAPYLDMANVPVSGFRAQQVINRAFGSGTRFTNGDTLLARITPCLENGKTAYVDFLRENQIGWGSTEFIVMRPRQSLPFEFGYLLARHAPFRTYAIQRMSGTSGRQRVSADAIAGYQLVIPPDPIAHAFAESVGNLFKLIKSQDEQSKNLAQIRDALLPKLMSGQFRIPVGDD